MREVLIVLATWLGLYLFIVLLIGGDCIRMAIGVMRGNWPKLTKLKWAAVPFVLLWYAFKFALRWPYYVYLEEKRRRDNIREIHRIARRMGIE